MHTVGVFQDIAWADRGLAALQEAGFARDALTVLAKHSPEASSLIEAQLGGTPEELEIEGIGPVVVRGPLIHTLQGSDDGLRTMGLAALFGRAGFQSHDGHIFATLVRRGGVLVGVASVPRAADALAKLHSYGAGNAAIGAWAGRV